MSPTCRDTWKWKLSDDGDFTFKELTTIIQDQIIIERQSNQETIWNRLLPRKINVFVWRAKKGSLLVQVDLDKHGTHLDIMLCPYCDNQIETVDLGLVLCKEAMKLCEKKYIWWGLGMLDKFSAKDILQHPGFSSISKSSFQRKVRTCRQIIPRDTSKVLRMGFVEIDKWRSTMARMGTKAN
ncbi:RNA-directed DNA polymerase, eukaryota, reverse transcriptase zinc-binding domain protein [Tanacetum coccineum]